MDGNAYQEKTRTTAIYVETVQPISQEEARIVYTMFGMMGELGELAEKVKKTLRGGETLASIKGDQRFAKELGDIAWYFSETCTELGFKVNDVLEGNVAKLASRKERGVLHGEGDDR